MPSQYKGRQKRFPYESVGKQFNDQLDEMLANGYGRKCRLLLTGTKPVSCNNCYINPDTKKSSGIYNGTGPKPFNTAICPICKGAGISTESTGFPHNMIVVTTPKDWLKPPEAVASSPDNHVMTISNLRETIRHIMKSERLIVNTEIEDVYQASFKRVGDPKPVGLFDDRFCYCYWTTEPIKE